MADPAVSVVIPVFNEQANLPRLFKRLGSVLDKLDRSAEIVFVNDGSRDGSQALLEEFHTLRPTQVAIIEFNRNYGQHMAVMAGFEQARGGIIVTLDADLQNPPEEIPKLLAAIDAGHDSVGGRRVKRQDSFFRRIASRTINHLRESITDIRMDDQGCMLRAYTREVIDAVVSCHERATFIPALAYRFSKNPCEVDVAHEARQAGTSKYSLLRLARLNFDLITGFSLVPLHLFTGLGILSATGSLVLVGILFFRRFIYPGASEAEGVFTLFAILFFLVSVLILGIGLIGEYVGRIYQVVQQRPRFVIHKIVSPSSF
ncbi:MAG: glycosyltransferase [Candidatus Methylacidiphilales bacterium]